MSLSEVNHIDEKHDTLRVNLLLLASENRIEISRRGVQLVSGFYILRDLAKDLRGRVRP
jgi:hypothetical protein